jgi:hypothetical protein
MKVITTSGKEFEINFEGTESHKQQRALFEHLESVGMFTPMDPEKDLARFIEETCKAEEFSHLDEPTIKMVCTYFFEMYANKMKMGEIDEIDFVIMTLSNTVLALEKW